MKREYVMTARAEAAQATADRIIAATFKRIVTVPYEAMRLEDIAADAGVTVQTVIRRFGSKDGLARAANEAYSAQVAHIAQRGGIRHGDIGYAVDSVMSQYEATGDLLLHLQRQEASVPMFSEFMEDGRRAHREWCREVFAPQIDKRAGVDRDRLLAQVVTACDVQTWFLLRRQGGLSRRQTALAITELLEGLLA